MGPRRAHRTGRHVEAVRALIVARRGAAGERTQPAAYPHGRALIIGVFSARMAFLANGKAGSGGLRPHEDLLAEFPFPRPAGSLTPIFAPGSWPLAD